MLKKTLLCIVLTVSLCTLCGCIVRSLNPWLTASTKVTEVSLVGTWHDADEDETVFISRGDDTHYTVLFVSDTEELSRFTASLHRVNGTLLLVVGPEKKEGMAVFTVMPTYLLFKVEMHDSSMKLYGIDLKAFGDRLKNESVRQFPQDKKEDGYVLLSSTKELASFVEAEMKKKSFFSNEPLYTFTRLMNK